VVEATTSAQEQAANPDLLAQSMTGGLLEEPARRS